MERSLLLCLSFLAACQPTAETCATFAELQVTNPDQAAPEGTMEQVQLAVDIFAGWTGRDGVCVEEVRLEDVVIGKTGEEYAGLFHGSWIEIDYGSGGVFQPDTPWHELCHAVDYQMGWVSQTLPTLFSPDAPIEDFALKCQLGPQPLSFAEGLQDACGLDFNADLWRWLDENVYPAAGLPYDPPEGTLPISLERQAVQGLPDTWDWSPIPAGGLVFLEGESDEGETQFFLVDPTSATVVGVLPAPVLSHQHVLLPSDGDPVLVTWGDDTTAWRVDSEAGGFTAVPFPMLNLGTFMEGVVLGDDAWILTQSGAAEQDFWRVDLETGEQEAFALPAGYSVGFAYLDGAFLAARGHDADYAKYFFIFDPGTRTWTVEPYLADVLYSSRLTLPDARSLLTYDFYNSGLWDVMGLAVRDPQSGAWWLADAPCSEDALALSFAALSINGEPWVWEFSNGWNQEENPWYGQHVLTRVVVDQTR